MRAVVGLVLVLGGCAAEVIESVGAGSEQLEASACELGAFRFESRRVDQPTAAPTPGELELLDAGDGLVTVRLPGVGRSCSAPMHVCSISIDCMTDDEVRMLAELTIDGDVLDGAITVEHAGGSVQLTVEGERSSSRFR